MYLPSCLSICRKYPRSNTWRMESHWSGTDFITIKFSRSYVSNKLQPWNAHYVYLIACLHCHAIKNKNHNHSINLLKNLGYDRCNINNLTKIEVCEVFICTLFGVFKFIELCVETPCWCPLEGHKHGNHKVTETFLLFKWKVLLLSSDM